MPLVLAIEPDPRQASTLKRVVKGRVRAELVVVDSKDAALSAIAARVPDLILVTALMPPRDEDDLTRRLKTLDHAGHLQTLTIPVFASAPANEKSGGAFGAFRRKKKKAAAIDGCDPNVFGDEIETYLQRAVEVREELSAIEQAQAARLAEETQAAEQPPAVEEEVTEAAGAEQWAAGADAEEHAGWEQLRSAVGQEATADSESVAAFDERAIASATASESTGTEELTRAAAEPGDVTESIGESSIFMPAPHESISEPMRSAMSSAPVEPAEEPSSPIVASIFTPAVEKHAGQAEPIAPSDDAPPLVERPSNPPVVEESMWRRSADRTAAETEESAVSDDQRVIEHDSAPPILERSIFAPIAEQAPPSLESVPPAEEQDVEYGVAPPEQPGVEYAVAPPEESVVEYPVAPSEESVVERAVAPPEEPVVEDAIDLREGPVVEHRAAPATFESSIVVPVAGEPMAETDAIAAPDEPSALEASFTRDVVEPSTWAPFSDDAASVAEGPGTPPEHAPAGQPAEEQQSSDTLQAVLDDKAASERPAEVDQPQGWSEGPERPESIAAAAASIISDQASEGTATGQLEAPDHEERLARFEEAHAVDESAGGERGVEVGPTLDAAAQWEQGEARSVEPVRLADEMPLASVEQQPSGSIDETPAIETSQRAEDEAGRAPAIEEHVGALESRPGGAAAEQTPAEALPATGEQADAERRQSRVRGASDTVHAAFVRALGFVAHVASGLKARASAPPGTFAGRDTGSDTTGEAAIVSAPAADEPSVEQASDTTAVSLAATSTEVARDDAALAPDASADISPEAEALEEPAASAAAPLPPAISNSAAEEYLAALRQQAARHARTETPGSDEGPERAEPAVLPSSRDDHWLDVTPLVAEPADAAGNQPTDARTASDRPRAMESDGDGAKTRRDSDRPRRKDKEKKRRRRRARSSQAVPPALAGVDGRLLASAIAALRVDIAKLREEALAGGTPPPRAASQAGPQAGRPAAGGNGNGKGNGNGNGNGHAAPQPEKQEPETVQDEWGFFNPERCGMQALLARLESAQANEPPAPKSAMQQMMDGVRNAGQPAAEQRPAAAPASARMSEPKRLAPLAMWARAGDPLDYNLEELLAEDRTTRLSPTADQRLLEQVSAVRYGSGCRIHRLRIAPSTEKPRTSGGKRQVVIVSRKALDELS